jgi:hypothetical protein
MRQRRTFGLAAVACLLLVAVATAWYWKNTPLGHLQVASRTHDLDRLRLEKGYNSYVRRIFIDRTEAGIIDLADGSRVKYWFVSHHHTQGESVTLFQFQDGSEKTMYGYFCCEVQLPEKQIESPDALRKFIAAYEGVKP